MSDRTKVVNVGTDENGDGIYVLGATPPEAITAARILDAVGDVEVVAEDPLGSEIRVSGAERSAIVPVTLKLREF